MTIIDKSPYKGLRFPKRQIAPRADQDRMRCGKCGGMDFEAHVRATGTSGRVKELICLGCLRFYHIDDHGFIEGGGKRTVEPLGDYTKPPLTDKEKVHG